MYLKLSSAKWRLLRLGLNVLTRLWGIHLSLHVFKPLWGMPAKCLNDMFSIKHINYSMPQAVELVQPTIGLKTVS